MIGFSEISRWCINKALFGVDKADEIATKNSSKIKEKFSDIEESFKNFDVLSFYDKIDLCYFILDTHGNQNVLLKIKNIITPEARKFITRSKSSSSIIKIEKNKEANIEISIEILQEYNQISIEDKIYDCISLLYGSDPYGTITHIILNKDMDIYRELYELLEITSSVMEQKQSFEVEKDIYKMWIAKQRDKKLESLLNDL